jgi:hypothetical protein
MKWRCNSCYGLVKVMVQSGLPRLGIIFDIDGLADPMYGHAAYVLLFSTILSADRALLDNSRLWDGDTNATLSGTGRQYVIAIEAADAASLDRVQRLMMGLKHRGLPPAAERFLSESALAKESLVVAARINELGIMDWCDASFVRNAWHQANKAAQRSSGLQTGREAGDPSEQRKPG